MLTLQSSEFKASVGYIVQESGLHKENLSQNKTKTKNIYEALSSFMEGTKRSKGQEFKGEEGH